MTKPAKPIELNEEVIPLNEEAVSPEFIEKIEQGAKQSGPVMTPDEMKACIDQL